VSVTVTHKNKLNRIFRHIAENTVKTSHLLSVVSKVWQKQWKCVLNFLKSSQQLTKL